MIARLVAPLAVLVSLASLAMVACSSGGDRPASTFEGSQEPFDAAPMRLPPPEVEDAGPEAAARNCSPTGLSTPPMTCTVEGTYLVTSTPSCENACELASSTWTATVTESFGTVRFDDGTGVRFTCKLDGCGCTTDIGHSFVFLHERFLGWSRLEGNDCTGILVEEGAKQ